MGGRPVLEIDEVSMDYRGTDGPVAALERVSLILHESDFVCVVGPSGCGKTTLLRIIAGFVAPTGGSVRLLGSPIREPDHQRGVVFQQPALYPWLSVQDNVEFGPKMRRIDGARRRQLAEDYLRMVKLWEFRAKPPYELSGGMQQRVAIARVLANDPKILLMDEPFGPLDAQTRQIMGNLLLDLWNADRKAVLFVTHDLEEAIALSDRVVIMSAGPAARIIGDWKVALPRPRDIAEVKIEPAFQDLHREIWATLKAEVLKGYAQTGGG